MLYVIIGGSVVLLIFLSLLLAVVVGEIVARLPERRREQRLDFFREMDVSLLVGHFTYFQAIGDRENLELVKKVLAERGYLADTSEGAVQVWAKKD